jgi:ESX secretion-associated protein EspG
VRSIDSVFRAEPGAAPVRALAAAGQVTAVLAIQSERGLSLRPIDPGGLVSAIVDLLPAAPRGTELSISVPADEFAEVATRITALPGLRGGQIAVNSRDPLGGRRRSPVLAWIDNPTGRYFGQVRPAMDGRAWTTVAPADAPTLRKRIAEMMTSITAGRR